MKNVVIDPSEVTLLENSAIIITNKRLYDISEDENASIAIDLKKIFSVKTVKTKSNKFLLIPLFVIMLVASAIFAVAIPLYYLLIVTGVSFISLIGTIASILKKEKAVLCISYEDERIILPKLTHSEADAIRKTIFTAKDKLEQA